MGSAGHPRTASVEVVSAASLLCVVPEPEAVAAAMWGSVCPGGAILVIETTALMTQGAVRTLDQHTCTPDDHRAISMWAEARRGRAVNPSRLAAFAQAQTMYRSMLSGLVATWLFRRSAEEERR